MSYILERRQFRKQMIFLENWVFQISLFTFKQYQVATFSTFQLDAHEFGI